MPGGMHLYSVKRFYISSHQLIQSTSTIIKAKEKQGTQFIIG